MEELLLWDLAVDDLRRDASATFRRIPFGPELTGSLHYRARQVITLSHRKQHPGRPPSRKETRRGRSKPESCSNLNRNGSDSERNRSIGRIGHIQPIAARMVSDRLPKLPFRRDNLQVLTGLPTSDFHRVLLPCLTFGKNGKQRLHVFDGLFVEGF